MRPKFPNRCEEADKFQKEMKKLGWRRVAVFDAALQEQTTREANPSASTGHRLRR